MFKIAAAQIPSVRGDIERNISNHLRAIDLAAVHGISVLIFPELSLMGYEPELAAVCQLASTDQRLIQVADRAKLHRMTIVLGSSIPSGFTKPYLGSIVFQNDGTHQTYAKMHLGGNESSYFSPGMQRLTLESQGHSIGLAICADSANRLHAQHYADDRANIYAASVFLNTRGMQPTLLDLRSMQWSLECLS